MNRPGAKLAAASLVASVGRLRNWRMRSFRGTGGSKENLFTKPEALLPQLEAFVDRQAYQNLRHGGIGWLRFGRAYTQFGELLASPLLAVLLFGLLRMRVTN